MTLNSHPILSHVSAAPRSTYTPAQSINESARRSILNSSARSTQAPISPSSWSVVARSSSPASTSVVLSADITRRPLKLCGCGTGVRGSRAVPPTNICVSLPSLLTSCSRGRRSGVASPSARSHPCARSGSLGRANFRPVSRYAQGHTGVGTSTRSRVSARRADGPGRIGGRVRTLRLRRAVASLRAWPARPRHGRQHKADRA
jgi:hypothetical protein